MSEAQKNSCQSPLRQSIPWYLNDTLSETEAALVRAHIEGCPDCRADLELHSSLRAIVLEREVTPILPKANAADVIGIGRTGGARRSRRGRVSSRWLSVAAGLAIVGVSLLVVLIPGNNTGEQSRVFETATSPGSSEGIDYILQVRFEDTVPEPQRARIAGQLDGVVKWVIDDAGTYEIRVRLPAASLEALKDYERRTDALPGVESAEFTALQLPMR